MNRKPPTKLMRVPKAFDSKVQLMTKRYGYKSKRDFLEKEGITIFDNVDYLNKWLRPVFNKLRPNVKK